MGGSATGAGLGMIATTEQQQAVDKWNSKYQIGQAALLLKDSGETIRTKTRFAAEVLSGYGSDMT